MTSNDLPASRAPWFMGAAALIIIVTVASLYIAERSEHTDVRNASAEAHLRLGEVQERLGQSDSILSALLTPDLSTAVLSAPGQPPAARLYHNRTRDIVVVTAFDLAPAAPGRTYQLWGISGDQAVSIGTFNTDANRRAVLPLRVRLGARYQSSSVTDEPAAGSSQPTTAPILTGVWSAGIQR